MPTPLTLSRQVRRLRLRTFAASWLDATATHAAWLFVLVGVGVILRRRFGSGADEDAQLLFLLPAAAAATGAWVAARRVPDATRLVTWLDVRGGGGGLLVTAFEREAEADTEAWEDDRRRVLERAGELPSLPLGAALQRLALAVGFALLCYFFRPPMPGGPGPPVRLFESLLAGATTRLEGLIEAGALESDRAQELRERLTELADSATQENAEAWFAALDRLGDELSDEGGLLRRHGTELLSSLARATQESHGGALLPHLGTALEKLEALGIDTTGDLSSLLEELQTEGFDLSGLGLAEFAKLGLGDVPLSPAALAGELSKAQMRQLTGDLATAVQSRFDSLARTGLFSPLDALTGIGRGGGRSAARDSADPWSDAEVGRGPRFEPIPVLTDGRLDPDGTPFDPPVDASGGEAAGLVELEASSGAGTWRRRIHPDHRRAVERFFTEPSDD